MTGTFSTVPTNYGILLFPGFRALDIFGPLDMLNALSMLTSLPAATPRLTLSIIAATLDPVSTSTSPDATFVERLVPTHTFDTAPPLDVLIIPGGVGVRDEQLTDNVVKFIKERYEKGSVHVITVCTGSWLVARAGILNGKKATSNKASWEGALKVGNGRVHWVAKARWVRDGNIWTTSGVSAGIDGTLAFIADTYNQEVAETLANNAEYGWHKDSTWDPWADHYGLTDSPVVSG